MRSKLIVFLRITFYCFMKPLVWFYVVLFQHVRFKKNGYKLPKGGVLFLSNHLSNWDGIYLNCMFFNRIIRFIVHDEMFKNKTIAWLSKNLLGEVCRGKTEENISDILQMRKLAKKGATLGLYPEGDIDMFGRTLPIEISIAKFVKLLKIPVVLTRVEGAGIRAPRFAKKPRHTHITYSITDVLSLEVINSLSLNELYNRILKGIVVDEYKKQSEIMYKQFSSLKRAESLELGLFYCPNCQSFETLYSKNDKVICKKCGFSAKYNRYCMMETKDDCFEYSLLTKWDDKQKEELYKRIVLQNENKPFLEEKELLFSYARSVDYFKKPLCTSQLKVFKNRLEITLDKSSEKKMILIKDIRKAILQYKDVLEIQNKQFNIRFQNKSKKWSAYLYVLTINYLIKLNEKKNYVKKFNYL